MNTPAENKAKKSIVNMSIPVMGANSRIQNRMLVFSDAPTKEFVLATLDRFDQEYQRKARYNGEWVLCADVIKQVPEELFSQMSQGKANRITYSIVLNSPTQGELTRIFYSRWCPVTDVQIVVQRTS